MNARSTPTRRGLLVGLAVLAALTTIAGTLCALDAALYALGDSEVAW